MQLANKVKSFFRLLKNDGLKRVIVEIIDRYHLPVRLSQAFRWEAGIKSQVRFWDLWFKTKGLRWPDEYQKRLDPQRSLQPRVEALLPEMDNCSILDVGAGPLTVLGKRMEGKSIYVTAVDPLADEYNNLLEKYQIEPIVRTEKLDAEKLDQKFDLDTFDLVYASNAIDHAYNPENAILQMIKVVKPNCYVLLEHAHNEAENQNYSGFHQWNFSMTQEKDFLISSKTLTVNMTKKYADICDIGCEIIGNTIITQIRKKLSNTKEFALILDISD